MEGIGSRTSDHHGTARHWTGGGGQMTTRKHKQTIVKAFFVMYVDYLNLLKEHYGICHHGNLYLDYCTGSVNFLLFLCETSIKSLAPGKFECNFRHVIFKQILVIHGWGISCEIALIWMSLDFTDVQSILVQVMAWCRQAPSHYLSQCWLRSL